MDSIKKLFGLVGINNMKSMKIAAQLAVLAILWFLPLTMHGDVDQFSGNDLNELIVSADAQQSFVVTTRNVSDDHILALDRYRESVLIALVAKDSSGPVQCNITDGNQAYKKTLRRIAEGSYFGRLITQNDAVKVSCSVNGEEIYAASIYSASGAKDQYVFTTPIGELMPEKYGYGSASPGFPTILY